MAKTITICPGAHKTGTTLLQNFLFDNAELLKAHGTSVFLQRHIRGTPFEHYLGQRIRFQSGSTTEAEARSWLRQTIDQTETDHLIISIENLLGEAGQGYRKSKKAVKILSKLFSGYATRCVFYIRRQDHMIESHYLQQFQHGLDLSFEETLRDLGELSWARIVGDLQSWRGTDTKVLFFEEIRAGERCYIERFLDACGVTLPMRDASVPPTEHYNNSISRDGLALLRRDWRVLDKTARIRRFEAIRARHNTSNGTKPIFFSDVERQEILRKYADENQRLIKIHAGGDTRLLRYYSPDYAVP